MLVAQLKQLPSCHGPARNFRVTQQHAARPVLPGRGRRSLGLTVVAADGFGKFFDKLKGGGGGDKGRAGGDEDSARKALQNTFGDQKKYKNFFGNEQQPQQGGGSGAGGFSGFGGGGGGGGGGGWGETAPEGGGGGPERPIMAEIWETFRYAWTVFWNLAAFLLFADILHRSLDWCCGVELLFLVGAPQQAFERLAGRFFAVIEWIEKNMLGWDIPGDEDMIPQYENLKLFYPRAHAYAFDQYRYNLTPKEKDLLINKYALRHYEREGGSPGDVDPADLQALRAKYEPMEADRQAYQRAKASNRLEDYWASRRDLYEAITKQRFVRPPGTQAPVPAQ